MDKLKVLIADDVVLYRKILSVAVEGTGLGHVEITASNGAIALEWLKSRNDIDIVLLDVSMPEMDGIETLKVIKKDFPKIEVIMISAGGSNNAAITLEALTLGAVDFILKPSGDDSDKNMEKIKNQLQMIFTQIKLKLFSSQAGSRPIAKPEKMLASVPVAQISNDISTGTKKSLWSGAHLVLIASSTGGPTALDTVCCGLPGSLNKPVLIVQHMPPDFTKVLAQTLDKKCQLSVAEAKEGDFVRNGHILIAPGGFHMSVDTSQRSGKIIRLLDTPMVNGVRPAADVLFQSVAEAYQGKNVLVAILTGMGNDGMRGVAELKKKCNCYCITQSEESCIVYGMPRSTYEAGLSDEVADLKNMASRIQLAASGRC